MSGSIKESDVLTVAAYLISTYVLSNAACLGSCNISVSDAVENRGFTVVNVSHYNNNRTSWFKVCIVIIAVINKTLLNGNDNLLFNLCTQLLSHQ